MQIKDVKAKHKINISSVMCCSMIDLLSAILSFVCVLSSVRLLSCVFALISLFVPFINQFVPLTNL